MDSLENLVKQMESQMDKADSTLDLLSSRLDRFESRVLLNEDIPSDQEKHVVINESNTEEMQVSGEDGAAERAQNDDEDDDGLDPKFLTELLSEVRRVKGEYDQLLMDVHQVQELQQEVTRSLRKQMKQVQNHFDCLRERVIGSTGGGNAPATK